MHNCMYFPVYGGAKVCLPCRVHLLSVLTFYSRNKENLIAKIKSHKLPFDLELHKYTKEYPGLLNDIQSLEAEGFVHVIEHDRDRGKIILHFLDPERRLKVDADIRALWHSVDISREMKKRPRPTD